jgi:integrator complex subunit 11
MFDFKHIKPFERSMADAPGPMVLFATPGMLHAGTSLEVFKKWATNDLNMCILPGYEFSLLDIVLSVFSYCVVGTVGNKLLAGQRGAVSIHI